MFVLRDNIYLQLQVLVMQVDIKDVTYIQAIVGTILDQF